MLNEIYQSLSPVAFTIGPFTVHWYGIAYIVSFILCTFMVYWVARKRWKINISTDVIFTVLIAGMLGVIIGARLGYVLFYGNGYYFQHPLEIFALSEGGMSFHGGLIGLIVAIPIAARFCHVPALTLGDLVCIAAPIGLGLVRIANFINGELWGAPTSLPWGVAFASGGGVYRHPTQLYEALLEGLVLFCLLWALSKRRPPFSRGIYTGIFLIAYGAFRIAIEFVRQPDVQLGYLFGTGWVTMGMMLSLPMVIGGLAVLLISRWRGLPQTGQNEEQESLSV